MEFVRKTWVVNRNWSLQPLGRFVIWGLALVGLAALSAGEPRPAKLPAVNAQFVTREAIQGPYWSLEAGFESSLVLSNTSDEPMQVEPWM